MLVIRRSQCRLDDLESCLGHSGTRNSVLGMAKIGSPRKFCWLVWQYFVSGREMRKRAKTMVVSVYYKHAKNSIQGFVGEDSMAKNPAAIAENAGPRLTI